MAIPKLNDAYHSQENVTNRSRCLRKNQSRPKPAISKPAVSQNGSDKLYVVEKVLKYRWINKKKYARIKWQGFPYSQSTWEPVESIIDLKNTTKSPKIQSHVVEVWEPAEKTAGARGEYTKYTSAKDAERYNTVQQLNPRAEAKYGKNGFVEPDMVTRVGIIDKEPEVGTDAGFLEENIVEVEIPSEKMQKEMVEEWSAEKICDYLCKRGYPEEASELYRKGIDGVQLSRIKNATEICQYGPLLGPALKLLRIIKRMQNGNFE